MAILSPDEMDFSNSKFSMIICGAPGVGKTTLALSAPNPIIVDLDKGIGRVKAQHRKSAIRVDTYEELMADLQNNDIKGFETIVIDTGGSLVTLLQDWAMRTNPTVNRTKGGDISIKGFGAVKAEFIRFTNSLKTILNKNIIFIFHTVEEKNKDGNAVQRLMCEGAARNVVWQPCDLGCFVYPQGEKRLAGFSPTDEYFAKGCYGISGIKEIPTLSENDNNNFVARLFATAKSNMELDKKYFENEKRAYDEAIKGGMELSETIINADTMNAAISSLKSIKHALTSEIEIKTMLGDKAKALGLVWNKENRCYEDNQV